MHIILKFENEEKLTKWGRSELHNTEVGKSNPYRTKPYEATRIVLTIRDRWAVKLLTITDGSQAKLGQMISLKETDSGQICRHFLSSYGNYDKHLNIIQKMVARGRIEPPTQGFSVLCSTD